MMIQTFERTQGIQSHVQNPDMEILEDVEDLENVLHDVAQKMRYQQKLTIFIVGYEETCGQRRHLLTQLQEFFSIYSNLNEEADQKPVQSIMDLDGIAHQVTQAIKSAEVAMSRLTDIHAGIISCVNRTMSAGAQGKRKSSDDRGRKKLEKALDQAKHDIGQITGQLLQAQEDLTFKDKQMKELVTQNERRFLEIQHVKSQLEVTKKSLQILQNETAMQQSLLEAELRRQERQLKELEGQETAKSEQLTDASTQWEILHSMSEDKDISVISEEEKNVKDFMETAEQAVITDFISEDTEVWASEMELQATDTDKSATESEQPFPCLLVFDENPSDSTLSAVVKEDNSVTLSVKVKEGDAVPTSYPSSENSQPSDSPPPIHDGNISPEEPGNKSKLNDSMGGNISATEPEKASDVSQASTETSSVSFISEKNLISNKDKSDHLNVSQITESMVESVVSQTVEEQIKDIMPLLPIHSNESHVGKSCQEPDENNHHLLSVALKEEHISPIAESDERRLSSPTSSSNSQITVHLMPTKDKDFLTIIHRPNKDSDLMTLSPKTVENTHFILSSNPEEGVQLVPPAFNTAESLSTSLDLNNVSMSSSSQESRLRISIPEPNNTAVLTSFSVQSNLTDSPSLITDSLLPVASLALHNVITKTEDIIITESSATPAETSYYTVPDPVGDRVDPAGSSVLCEDFEEIEMKKLQASYTEQGKMRSEKSLNSEHSAAQMWNFSERLHTCVQEIKDLLMNKGFYSLVDGLTAGLIDHNEDDISRNLMHLNHLPAVLNSLLHSASKSEDKQTADEPAQSADTTHRNMGTQTDSHLPMRHTDAGDQHPIGIPSRLFPDSNSASTHTSIFTQLDEEHNRRVLQRASDQGKIPLHVYQDASRVMSEHRRLRQERLRSLASGYVQYISWNKVENHLQRQCLTRPHIKPALSKIKVLKHQVFLRWKERREQSHQEKLNLSISLNQVLQGVQEDSGIFLIKPVLSWPGRSLIQEGHSQILSHYRAPQRTRLPPLDQEGILCSGKVQPCVPKEWKTTYTDTEIRPVVVTPKLLEMDVHRYLSKECGVSQIRSSAAGLLLRSLPPQKLVSIKQTSSFPAI